MLPISHSVCCITVVACGWCVAEQGVCFCIFFGFIFVCMFMDMCLYTLHAVYLTVCVQLKDLYVGELLRLWQWRPQRGPQLCHGKQTPLVECFTRSIYCLSLAAETKGGSHGSRCTQQKQPRFERGGLHKHNLEFNLARKHFIHILCPSDLSAFVLFCRQLPSNNNFPTPEYICSCWYRTQQVMDVRWLLETRLYWTRGVCKSVSPSILLLSGQRKVGKVFKAQDNNTLH